jgi:hypothetical protein
MFYQAANDLTDEEMAGELQKNGSSQQCKPGGGDACGRLD